MPRIGPRLDLLGLTRMVEETIESQKEGLIQTDEARKRAEGSSPA